MMEAISVGCDNLKKRLILSMFKSLPKLVFWRKKVEMEFISAKRLESCDLGEEN